MNASHTTDPKGLCEGAADSIACSPLDCIDLLCGQTEHVRILRCEYNTWYGLFGVDRGTYWT